MSRPTLVTAAGTALILSAVLMVLLVFADSAQLDGAVRAVAMVEAGCAVAAAILGVYVLRRSSSARVALAVVAGPLLLVGLFTSPAFAIIVGFCVLALWLPAANRWFAGDDRDVDDHDTDEEPRPTMSESPSGPEQGPTPPPYGGSYGGAAPSSNPYGNPYGSPYGNPYGAPPPYPTSPYGPAGPPRGRPGAVVAASIVTLVLSGLAALLGLMSAVVGAADLDAMIRALHDQGYDTGSDTRHALQVALIAGGCVMVVLSVAAIVAAILVLRRSQAARVTLTVLSGITVLLSLLAITSGVSVVTLAGAIAVIVLLNVGSSARWFARR